MGRDGQCVHSVFVHGERCRLRAAPRVRDFPVLMRVEYSAVCAVGWCGMWSCVGTVHMGVQGRGVVGGWVHSVFTVFVHGVRCRLRIAPLLREFPVLLHAGYSAVCAVGWCGKFDGVRTVDMGVRGSGVMGGWARSVLGMVRGAGCAQRPACVWACGALAGPAVASRSRAACMAAAWVRGGGGGAWCGEGEG